MSDIIPQCLTCKYNPCKWFDDKQRKKINLSYEKCKYFEQKKEFDKILN